MKPDELLEQRIKRVIHHINAIQRLVDTTVLAVLAVDRDGRPNIIANPGYDVKTLREVMFAFAVEEYEEGKFST